ncbi:hypothetical protein M9H77_08542 [Catharanthus roseus]|uniref:Uncharacterized protein n=1 Tax=Catharanthus roseus TaxID=4058 RepID=A0ACC0BYB4_CATRO|nr:hypothetical protein M9H77_08542 [Catharanthus roseus]
MVKTKNANVGQGQNPEERGTSRRKGKGKRVPSGARVPKARAPDRFISVKEAARFEEWTRNRRKIAPGHRVDLNDMQGMEAIPHLCELISWIPLLIVNELYYVEMIYKFYANLHKGRIERVDNIPHHGERWFEEIFTRGEVLKKHDDRNLNKLDTYRRLLHHMIFNIIIPNVAHKSSITNMHSFVMLALHEHRRMNFGYMSIDHMLATQSSSTKCLPYGCFITKILQHFVINLVGIGDHISHGKIFNQQTFKRMGFEKSEVGTFIRGGQHGNDDEEEDDDEDQEDMHVGEGEKGSSAGSMSHLTEMMASLQTSINTRFDVFDGCFEVLDGKVSKIQERLDALDHKMTDIQERVMRLEQGGGDRDD